MILLSSLISDVFIEIIIQLFIFDDFIFNIMADVLLFCLYLFAYSDVQHFVICLYLLSSVF
jgi:hypothetical protein